MTEKSYYWDGTAVGDASLAPYNELVYHENWYKLFSRKNNGGVIDDYLNELAVTGVSGGIQVATGAAICDGWFYENDNALTVEIPTPTTNPRIDTISIRMDFAAQTVRANRIAGTEAASPTAPAITQNHGAVWDIELAYVSITTGGVITVTDRRLVCNTPLGQSDAIELIEEVVVAGVAVNFTFENIPQIYRDLLIIGQWRGTAASFTTANVLYNDDNTSGNYMRQVYNAGPGAAIVAAGNNSTSAAASILVDDGGLVANEGISFKLKVHNYTNQSFYKMTVQEETISQNLSAGNPLAQEGSIWLNTNSISKITLAPTTGEIDAGSVVSLYGLGIKRV
jgi:hypothetical protein